MKKRSLLMLSLTLCVGFIVTSCNNKEVSIPQNDCSVIIESGQNGSIVADKTAGNVGDKVTLTITPNTNYQLETLTVNGTSHFNDFSRQFNKDKTTISNFLKSGKFNDGTSFDYNISIDSIDEKGATITFVK